MANFLIYSDLHLECNNPMLLSQYSGWRNADALILAGDILTFDKPDLLKRFFNGCKILTVFVAGNHEYYCQETMDVAENNFHRYLAFEFPNVVFLRNESVTWGLGPTDAKYEIFGGTMWTDFNNSNPLDMYTAETMMNDYKQIRLPGQHRLRASDTVKMHTDFLNKVQTFLKTKSQNIKIVVSHHAPVIKQNSKYNKTPNKLQAAFNSTNVTNLIHECGPDVWIYGHTHEQDDQIVGKTRIVSNPFGYYQIDINPNFQSSGVLISV